MHNPTLPEDYYEKIKPHVHQRIGRELRLARVVVDVGCGSCDLVRYLAQTYRQEVTGVDLFSAGFPEERRTHGGIPFRCVSCDATGLNCLQDSSVDAVVSMWSFHEIGDPEKMLTESGRILRPGGELLIVDFPRDSLAQRLWNESYYRPDDIAEMVRQAGFTTVGVRLIEKGQIAWVTAHRRAAPSRAA